MYSLPCALLGNQPLLRSQQTPLERQMSKPYPSLSTLQCWCCSRRCLAGVRDRVIKRLAQVSNDLLGNVLEKRVECACHLNPSQRGENTSHCRPDNKRRDKTEAKDKRRIRY